MDSRIPSTQPHALRIPAFAGALNFRDLGGYSAANGRTVRWNVLYRSGTTHAMTHADLEHVVSRGIRYACDLRSNSERRNFPSRLDGVADIEYWYRDHDKLPGDMRRYMRQTGARPELSRAMMMAVYKELPYEFRDAYRELFLRLSRGQVPLVFNCTAGKDRTGVAAALVLTALGVPREVIYEDYMMTEQFYEQCCAMMQQDGRGEFFHGILPHVWEPMMRADSAYLDAMFDRLIEAHGSVPAYLRDELGVRGPMIEALHEHLLEAPSS